PFEALRAAAPGAPELVSGAGHDAMVLAAAGVPTAMLFVRSLNGGVSHSPDELSNAEDIAIAGDTLTAAPGRPAPCGGPRGGCGGGGGGAAARGAAGGRSTTAAPGPTSCARPRGAACSAGGRSRPRWA